MDKTPNCQTFPIPKTEQDITEDWISKVTNFHPVRGSISVNGNIQAGIGFSSNLCRVTFQIEGASQNENLLVKLLPDDAETLAFTRDQKFDRREIQFYSTVYPQIVDVAPDLRINLCKYYGGAYTDEREGNDYESVLVIEDLKPLGYEMLNTESENWRDNLKKVVAFLAKLHAAGTALEKSRKVKLSNIFPFCIGGNEDEKTDMLVELCKSNCSLLGELLTTYNYPEEMKRNYAKLAENIESLLVKSISKGAEFPTLIHGDIWPPNILVSDSNPNADIKVVDWQLLGYRDATADLSVAIISCLPSAQLSKRNVNEFLQFYYNEFKQAYCKYGHNYTGRSEDEFINFFNTWGMALGYFWWLVSVDSYPDQERLGKIFELMHKEYKITEFLLNDKLCT